jgi:diacylglycerol kinase family enzyme
MNKKIDVIATTMSGSIKDWAKVKHIVPLFEKYGFNKVSVYEVDSHLKARTKTLACLQSGTRTIIAAGGSGTFNAVLEGCCDSGIDLNTIDLGFLRKGSADLIGKVLGMPDEINEAIDVFTSSINAGRTIKCDIIQARTGVDEPAIRHFVGYGGASIFGDIPRYTENRFIKYYKGVLGQLFGDMGPFFVGAILASLSRSCNSFFRKKPVFQISIDQELVTDGKYQALIIVNGDLGKNLPLAKDVPLGSGDFWLFALRDIGLMKLPGQFKRTWNASIQANPEKWGFESFRIPHTLRIELANMDSFNANIDGSIMKCTGSVDFEIIDQLNLISGKKEA